MLYMFYIDTIRGYPIYRLHDVTKTRPQFLASTTIMRKALFVATLIVKLVVATLNILALNMVRCLNR